MKQQIKILRLIAMGGIIISFISCTSTTTIRAIDKNGDIDRNVKIYTDGSYKGKGEVVYSDTKIVGSITSVNLRKKNCRSAQHNLSRSENLDVGALVGGIFFFVPFLWIMGYNPVHSYEFFCE